MIELPEENITGETLMEFLNKKVWVEFAAERERLAPFDAWVKNSQDVPVIAYRHQNQERQVLLEISRQPWMGLMVNTFAQQLIVDGYKKSGTNEDAEGWDTWNRNHMHRQQFSLNRAVMTFGYAYLKVTESTDPLTDKQMAAMKGVSPMRCFALYEDPYGDEWPRFVLEKQPSGKWFWWDDEGYHILAFEENKFRIIDYVEHDYADPPFVRYVNQLDLDGRCIGDVEPLVQVAKLLDKTKFDILLAQHYTGFMVRYATGLQQPDNMENIEKEKIRLAQEDFLISSNEKANFGVLPPTPMEGLLESYKESLTHFLAAAQLPPQLVGQMVNVAADALTAGTRPTVQKLREKQASWSVSHNQAMRLVNTIEGRKDQAVDLAFAVHWQDVEIKSLAQFADAWGKMVEALKIPAWGVWDMIPDIDQSTVEGWKKDYNSDDEFIKGIRELQTAKEKAALMPKPAAPAGPGGQGGPNSAANQRKLNNKTGQPNPRR